MSSGMVIQFLLAAMLGASVSYLRLAKSFRDAPVKAVFTPPGGLFIGISALLSGVLLFVAWKLNWRFGLDRTSSHFGLGLTQCRGL